MKYYKTKEDITELVRSSKPEPKHRSQIFGQIQARHGVIELGYLTSVVKDSVWFGNARGEKNNQINVTEEVLDFIFASGMFDDAVNQNSLVTVFGSIKNGKVIDIAAINLNNLAEATAS